MPTPQLTPEQTAKIARLRDDFIPFARNCLKIRKDSGIIEPFELNRAQIHIHERIEKQRKEKGKVRVIVLKARQLGVSTYIQGRYYWRNWGGKGLKAFILTHEQAATDNLFVMAQRFHDYMPEGLKPPTKAANAKELVFAHNGCGYAVATAGSKGVGRSATLQLFHASECGFWPNADDHIDGVFQALADAPGTESIIESTANGIGNVFQRLWVNAERGDSDYEAIFCPWFWDERKERPCPSAWKPSPEWLEYGEVHNLEWPQLYWAYCRNRDMAASVGETDDKPCWKFRQEHCATANEAFVSSGNSFIPALHIMRARQEDIIGVGPVILGIDLAAGGGDKTAVIDRCGRRMGQRICERWDERDTMVTVGRIANIIRRLQPDMVNIDVGGIRGVVDRLIELGFSQVNAIDFGSRPIGRAETGGFLYANRRAEMWDSMREWFSDPQGVQIPDDDALQTDLTAPVWGSGACRINSANELLIEPKDKIRERLGFSPDLGDSAALTLAIPYMAQQPAAHRAPRAGRNRMTGY